MKLHECKIGMMVVSESDFGERRLQIGHITGLGLNCQREVIPEVHFACEGVPRLIHNNGINQLTEALHTEYNDRMTLSPEAYFTQDGER
jgi:hypothetical protein